MDSKTNVTTLLRQVASASASPTVVGALVEECLAELGHVATLTANRRDLARSAAADA